MKNISENQGNPRIMSDYYSPTGKVKDYLSCPLQECSTSLQTYFQETPMKPSQVKNRLLLSLPKMMFPLQSHKTLTPTNMTRDSHSCPKVAKAMELCQNNAFRGPKETAQTALSGKLVARSNCSLLKRCTDSEGIDSSLKKTRLQNPTSCTVQMPNCTASQSQRISALSSSSSSDLIRLELSTKNTKMHVTKEPTSYQSVSLVTPSPLNPKLTLDSPPRENILSRLPGVGKAQMVKVTEDYVYLRSPSKSFTQCLRRLMMEAKSRDGVINSDHQLRLENGSTTVQDSKDRSTNSNGHLASHQTHRSQRSNPAPQVKLPCKDRKSGRSTVEEIDDACRTSKRAAKSTTTGPLSSHMGPKKSSTRRPSVIPDDIGGLFTPDPLTYVSGFKQKAGVRPPAEQGKLSPRNTEGTEAAAFSTPSAETPYRVTKHSTGTNSPPLTASVTVRDVKDTKLRLQMPIVKVQRLKVGKQFKSISLVGGFKIPFFLPNELLDTSDPERVDVHNTWPNRETSANDDTSPVTEGSTSEFRLASTLPSSKEDNGQGGEMAGVDDMELGLDLQFGLDLDESQSCKSWDSSESEQLPSLQEMMQLTVTPEKRAFPEPTASIISRCQSVPNNKSLKTTTTAALDCTNNLDLMLKEIRNIKRSKEIESVLLTSCREYDLTTADCEEDENQDGAITSEQQEFLQRFPVVYSTIRDVHPGEVVFNLETCGSLFSQRTLQLRHCKASPQGTAQKTLLWSSPAQLNLHIRISLVQNAFNLSPCPPQVTCCLFKMMSVHTDRMISNKILQDLFVIGRTAAYHIVKSSSQKFKVWVPSLADVTLVLLNMGVSFVTLFPLEKFQPPFNERDLLEDIDISSDSPSSSPKLCTFQKHNYSNVLKYLSYCMALCPRAFSDPELLLLLALSSRLGLEVRFALEPHMELRCLQRHILCNVQDWEDMLPRMCLALTELTTDHHNMCCLVQLLPDDTRGKQLRRHLSVCMISKLLDGSCTYKPSGTEFKLSSLKPFLSRMKPSSLLQSMRSSCSGTQKEDTMDDFDQQTYYLCYSLLTLVNQASNFTSFQPYQKEQLLELCCELDRHIKRDMKENDKCLYRNKVNDLVARIYTKWWMLVQRHRPLNDKLYDFWKPSPEDMLSSSTKTIDLSEEEHHDSPDHPGLSSDKEDEMDQGLDEDHTGAIENNDDPVQMNGPTGGDAGVVEPS